jgi:hypothetical protein
VTTELAPPARSLPRSLPIIAGVAVAAIAVGGVAGAFLLGDRTAGAGRAAGYVPADVPFYLELRLDPSDAQDAALRELLGHFPSIEGVDLERPLFDQLGEAVDDAAASADATDLRWADDVAPWFDGHVTLAVTDVPLEPAADGSQPMPEMLVVLGSSDADAARAAAERMRAEAGPDATFTETEHRGVTVVTAEDDEGAYAITDDAVLLAPTAAQVQAALDVAAGEGEALAGAQRLTDAAAALPNDWLAFAVYDLGDLVTASLEAEGADVPTEPLRALIAEQPMAGAMAVTADGDRLALTSVSDAPSGDLAMENADRGLADEVPADALYYADGGNIGPALAAFVTAIKESAAGEPEAADQIATAEAALGADLEELVSWVDDAALVVAMDGDAPYAGAVLVPSDPDAAQRRIGQVITLARLGTMDSGSGISVEETDVDGTTVTSIAWRTPAFGPEGMVPGPDGMATIELATTDDRAYLGIGSGSVARLLAVDAGDSLATVDRFSQAVDQLGGSDNAGTVWLDLRGVRTAIESALGPMLDEMDPDGAYEREVLPWLEPLDRMVGVTRVEDDQVVQRSVLLVD